ncbi:MAG: tetratricopeptide repeat protein [Planctomycetaceae bacterium]|nr:tetratricopeptide repeat protein [Planctomycetaceae bacterium]
MSRRQKLEALLAESPEDSFLNYALAMQCSADGDQPAAIERFDWLIERDPQYVAAYFQLAQIVVERGETDRARQLLTRGIEMARRAGDDHAEGEMRGFLEQLAG